jgi:dextranase
MLAEFMGILQKTDFDGIHLDQYGDPKVGYDAQRKMFDLGQAIADTITETHKVVDENRKDGAVVFNCVTNWPVELASVADEDIIYIEVWEPYSNFSDLHNLVTYAQSLGTGKPVVLAAYVHPANSANPMLMDAIIFGSGGGHIELGENFGYLAEAYFPKYDQPTASQKDLLQNYYDFAVRYQDLIGPRTKEVTGKWIGNIQLGDLRVGVSEGSDVFALARESENALAISLVNLTGVSSFKWNVPVGDPNL